MMSSVTSPVCPRVDAYIETVGTGSGAEDPLVEPPDAPTDELRDTALHEEIELVGQLVVAATSTPHRLSQQEIDKVLGVEPED
jgi:hypothetical protein